MSKYFLFKSQKLILSFGEQLGFWILGISLIMINSQTSFAQISPGDLSQAHEELEGIRNCTQCHVIGEKVSDEKCLACHDEMQTRITANKGYHSSIEVKSKDCASCHSDHHGRNFDMVRFDEQNFAHQLTGYKLEGAHAKVDCRDCHLPEFIVEPTLKLRKETYLGLSQTCTSCHEDYHQGTLTTDCASCHVADAFSPASLFDHDVTSYPLKGKHKDQTCQSCHEVSIKNGKDFQKFADLEFANCNSCHKDEHKGNLGRNCKQCHTEQSFDSHSSLANYNHNQTAFKLKASHKRIDCASCHDMNVSVTQIFQKELGIPQNNCVACHEDVHENKYGNQCIECHNETSFSNVNLTGFDHSTTDFNLEGRHVVVDCKKCHIESFRDPVPHNECASCHSDYHQGQFEKEGLVPDCNSCHTVDGFDNTLYSIEEHNKSDFPLEGAHIATPCFACHLKDEEWSFREIGQRCIDCHEDVHEDYIAEKYYPGQSCENCHVSDSWEMNHFDHDETNFSLLGKHRGVDCMECHKTEENNDESRYTGFVETSTECINCHENVHGDQFLEKGKMDCAKCHGFESWGMAHFNHDNTAFKLEGKHAELTCDACHKEVIVNDEIFTQYKFESFECIDCHL